MVAKPLCPLYKNIIKPLDRARYPELRYELHDGFGNTLVSDALGYPEILQLIIHEVDGVLMLADIQILQRRRELHIIILSGDALG